MNRDYELMVIFIPEVDDSSVSEWISRIQDMVSKASGQVYKVEKWGKRHLAYEVKHKSDGIYSVIDFSCEPEGVFELDRVLRLADEVLRHKIIKLPPKIAATIKNSSSGVVGAS